jgi:glycosyltransferase involved in cell wall biosynthesis
MSAIAPVDVVVPVQDVDEWLGDALRSVVGQTVPVASVVVVDAGSVRPVRLPAALADGCALVRRDERLFAGAARNVGASHGTAPWLAFLDADDVWPPGRTAVLLDLAGATGAGWVYGMVESFAAPGGLAGAGLVRRSLFDAVGGFDPALAVGEFVDLAARLRRVPVVERSSPEVTLRRRVHSTSTTAGGANRDAYLSVVRAHLARAEGEGP